ncbi:MAG: sensor histidine kinase KdpD [Bryobacterales bacterium]|nr:sensor histidine kinase KdpD [Bryobacterales bacterium]
MEDGDRRPNPDELLERVAAREQRAGRGRLKIFFGAMAGVGKTYAMLEAGRAQQRAGVDVVAGYVETHGRKETEAVMAGLEVLPRKEVEYKGMRLTEFDLEGALARRPALLLVDELAHTNAAGSRHAKRWQDVMELLGAGIDVHTTLNVQHLESLRDVVGQVTGVAVRETMPDSVVDDADEIELVDLPAEDLLRRLAEGKIYASEQARRAAQHFFRPGNLIALREMALRKTADRVDAQMRDYRRSQAIGETWAVRERLLVCVGPSPYSAQLVRATARLAARSEAPWSAVFVETPGLADAEEAVRARVLETLRLAEQLGGSAVTLPGMKVSSAVLQYARTANVTAIVVGKPREALWRRLWRGSLVDELLRESGDIEIHAIQGGAAEGPGPGMKMAAPRAREIAYTVGMVALCTALTLLLRSTLAAVNLAMIYLLGVIGVAMRSSREAAFLASALSIAAFDFFCVPPYLTFAVADYQYLVTFAVMLVVAMLISHLTAGMREQAQRAAEREGRTQALYAFTKELAGEPAAFEAARRSALRIGQLFERPAMILLPEEGRITFRKRTSDRPIAAGSEEAIAQWVFDRGEMAGQGTDTLSGASALYLPLKAGGAVLGVLALGGDGSLTASPERLHQLELFAAQTAAALERIRSGQAIRESELRMQTEEMRSSLLSAVSHDLRTPLATITGAATSLRDQWERLPAEARSELLESIAEEGERMGRLVQNLLEMTRLDAGGVEIHRDWHTVEEMVGAALERMEKPLARHAVKTALEERLPLVQVDDVLMQQVLVNLLENAAKYTPAGTEVEIAAYAGNRGVVVEVRDRGPGFAAGEEAHVFEKFYRGSTEGVRGVGLGLAISQAIVRAHGGSITAANRAGGGAVIRIVLAGGEE